MLFISSLFHNHCVLVGVLDNDYLISGSSSAIRVLYKNVFYMGHSMKNVGKCWTGDFPHLSKKCWEESSCRVLVIIIINTYQMVTI